MEDPMSYNVAFVYTQEAGSHAGIVTWSSWPSKGDFDKAFAEWPEELKRVQRVLEEGITRERAVELVGQTPTACRISAAFEEATLPDGAIDPFVLDMELQQLAFLMYFERRDKSTRS